MLVAQLDGAAGQLGSQLVGQTGWERGAIELDAFRSLRSGGQEHRAEDTFGTRCCWRIPAGGQAQQTTAATPAMP